MNSVDNHQPQLPIISQEPAFNALEPSNSKRSSLRNPATASLMHTVKSILTSSPGDPIASVEAEDIENSQVRVKASILSTNECNRICPCQCHRIQRFASPVILAPIIGHLFVGYTGLPLLNRKSCNRISCQRAKGQVHIRIAYFFPLWFFLRLIIFSITKVSSTILCSLKTPVITQSSAPNFIYASTGRIDAIKAFLSANTAGLNAIDSIGSKSLLHVSVISISVYSL